MLCISSNQLTSSGVKEGPRGQGSCANHCSSLDDPELVSRSPSVTDRPTDPPAQRRHSIVRTSQQCPSPPEGRSGFGRMDIIRQSLRDQGFSNEAARLICASWSSGTNKQYNSAWRKLCCWCNKRQIDILQAPLDQVANFLSESFAAGKSYSTINTYRSALSSTLYPFNNPAVGTHSLIVRLVKEVYSERPPAPRYSTTWDVTKVTDYWKHCFRWINLISRLWH